MDEGIKERFAIIRQKTGLKINQFASNLDMAPTTVSSIESGGREPSKEVLVKLATVYGVNLHWMLTGEGDMYAKGLGAASNLGSGGFGAVGGALRTLAMRQVSSTEIMNLTDFINLPPATKFADVTLFAFRHGVANVVETEEDDPNALTLLPLFGQPAAAGPGQPPAQIAEVEGYIPVLFGLLGSSHPRDCGLVRVIGDSMTDITLFSGDLAIFDRSQVDGDGVYVISIAGDIRIKRVEYRPVERKIIISSENAKRYPNPETMTYDQALDLLQVFGKVIGWIHKHPY